MAEQQMVSESGSIISRGRAQRKSRASKASAKKS
jgi:hypothetical protein